MIYPFYGQATTNNGIISYNQLTKTVLNNEKGKPTILIHSNNQNIVYVETPFYLKDGHGATSVLQSAKLNKRNQMFIVGAIHKVIKTKYSYNNKATKIELKNSIINLPIKKGKIDFEFIESFTMELEKLHVLELEVERIQQLNLHLLASGLKDYNLSDDEQKVLDDYESGKLSWCEFNIGNLFEKIKINTLKYKTSKLPNKAMNDYILPALTAGIKNQGLNNYVPIKNATVLKNVISVSANGANTGATFYQNKEFTVLQDAYAINWKYSNDVLTENIYLFFVGAISKTIFGNYEWTNKAGWERIKEDKIQLLVVNNKPNYSLMETLISAINKLVIKDVVLDADKKIEATKSIVN
jgi:hypothetical protein